MAEGTENVDTSLEAASLDAPTLPEPASGLWVITHRALLHFGILIASKNASTFTPAERDEDLYDSDSAYGAYSDITDTASLNSHILKFRKENGRTYHSYGKSFEKYPALMLSHCKGRPSIGGR